MAAELNASAEVAGQLGAALGAAGDAQMAVAAELGGMDLGGLPSMGDLPLAATVCQSFEGATGMPLLSATPCPNIFCVGGK